jgi:ATP-dependent helicase/nuclease subunit A
MTDVARANNFTKDTLEISKKRSRESFEALLPPAQTISDIQWNNRLLALIDQTVAALDANDADGTKTTREAAEELRNLQNQLKWRGELHWHEWVKISKVKVGAKSRDLFEELQELARSHDEHPRFRSDVGQYIELVFDIATDALQEYEQYKKKRGLIDYTDMETYVSRLLRIESVREALRTELDLLLVDEFQDTSPIQLDIFLQLSRLARHSIWVGDPKQSIYGFRGAEPALMQAIIRATGGVRSENILEKSWRSRPDIVYAVNAIFTCAFPELPPEQVALEPAHAQQSSANSLLHWHFRNELDHRKVPGSPWMENGIAEQIQVLLDRQTPVWSKKRDSSRPARPGDIAVLCRANRNCEIMAEALHRAGLKAAIARAGLLETTEGKLVLACLKFLLTPSDALSAAEILALTGAQTLEQIVADRLDYLHRLQQGEDQLGRWAMEHDFLRRLYELRPRTADLSASEILNLLLAELDLRRIAVRFGNAAQRLDNLDRLRRYALDYESACQRLHAAASLGGFLLWLTELARSEQDYQGSGESPDAVQVMTYHKSKGLEFPIAICHNLNQPARERVWGISLVSEREEPDLDNILGHRWLRFWENPYADQSRGTRLEETLRQSDAWAQAAKQAREEEARLLYVGLTRARDYLVFPTNTKGTPWLNRVFRYGDESIPTLDPDSAEPPFVWNDRVIHCDTELLFKPKDFPEAQRSHETVAFHAPHAGKHPDTLLPYRVDAPNEWPAGFRYTLGEPVAFAEPLEVQGDYAPEIGRAVQAFLLADTPIFSHDQRLALARLQVQNRGVGTALDPELLLRHSEAFRQFAEDRFAPQSRQPKLLFEAAFGHRRLSVETDLFLENETTAAVLLFAGFAEGMKKWKDQAKATAPVAGWIAEVLPNVFPGKKVRYWVVFPVDGQAVELLFLP